MATRRTLAPSALDPVTGLPTGSIYRIIVVPEPSAMVLLACGLFTMLAAGCVAMQDKMTKSRELRKLFTGLLTCSVLVVGHGWRVAVDTGLHDDFQNGTAGWVGSFVSPPTVSSTGGPDGDGDAFLRVDGNWRKRPDVSPRDIQRESALDG